MKWPILFMIIFLLLSTPAFALFAPEPDEQSQGQEEVPLGVGLLTVAGLAGFIAFIKKEKRFMRKHTFRFKKIRKSLREEDYDE